MKFGQQAPGYTLQGKNQFPSKEDPKIESRIRIDFAIVWILDFIFEIHLLI
jgi:hypothetical protein